jgi:hypothetical protein
VAVILCVKRERFNKIDLSNRNYSVFSILEVQRWMTLVGLIYVGLSRMMLD